MNISEKQITEYRIDYMGCGIAEVINTGYDYKNEFYNNLNKQNAEVYFRELGWTEKHGNALCPWCSVLQGIK
jgi:hypothetical protein